MTSPEVGVEVVYTAKDRPKGRKGGSSFNLRTEDGRKLAKDVEAAVPKAEALAHDIGLSDEQTEDLITSFGLRDPAVTRYIDERGHIRNIPPEDVAGLVTKTYLVASVIIERIYEECISEGKMDTTYLSALDAQVHCLDILVRVYGLDKRRIPATSVTLENEAIFKRYMESIGRKTRCGHTPGRDPFTRSGITPS